MFPLKVTNEVQHPEYAGVVANMFAREVVAGIIRKKWEVTAFESKAPDKANG